MKRSVVLSAKVFDELADTGFHQPKLLSKIIQLIQSCLDDPFNGIGKPEPLKHNLKGYWSRRINEEHRLVYKVEDDQITIISCREHY